MKTQKNKIIENIDCDKVCSIIHDYQELNSSLDRLKKETDEILARLEQKKEEEKILIEELKKKYGEDLTYGDIYESLQKYSNAN